MNYRFRYDRTDTKITCMENEKKRKNEKELLFYAHESNAAPNPKHEKFKSIEKEMYQKHQV